MIENKPIAIQRMTFCKFKHWREPLKAKRIFLFLLAIIIGFSQIIPASVFLNRPNTIPLELSGQNDY